MEPGDGAFDDPAEFAEAGAMFGAAAGDAVADAAFAEQAAVLVVVVAAVGEDFGRSVAGSAWAAVADGWDFVEERQQLGDVVAVAAGQ
ncbi:hypothetical protein GCM10023205_03930 [Yinghuangia aomiensis]|uniref:Uncharacterized protein n=1 Tax=Yinghuangia aomiensis TaxID=676205 RepID=A0ABP9GLB8_9ACTN